MNVNSYCNSKGLFFYDLMDILKNFNYLRHNNYLLHNLLKYIRHLNQFLLMRNNRDRHIDNTIYYLQYFFNMVDISHSFFEFFEDNSFLDYSLNFLNSFILIS